MSAASPLYRLLLGIAAVALLSGQAPRLPMPNATPTPMAVPRPSAKPKPTAKPKPKPKPTAKPSPAPTATPTPRPSVFPAFSPLPGGVFPAGTPAPAPGSKFPKASATPTYRGFGSPPPTPTPPPPHAALGAVFVNWGGLSTQAVTLRYGQPLRLRGAKGFNRPLHLFVVNPNEHFTQTNATAFARFPKKLTYAEKLAWLGDAGAFKHLHWAIARGTALDLQSEAFLSLYERIAGGETGYIWPMRFLFYVAVAPPRARPVYYKLVVTVTK
ncbi:MAG: hypothetical protein JWM80_4178 [Cyanobacteria bacterium RYN_339]|nr:hypothetical protein [Cyanobacteria bacterium RYN_339]